eukprot:CAMPEP_0201532364 /NCGR_PEP_ID=MMETSP0161_2-20130828/50183_1 /ASSEMBLY_ACC=CAM_ASM_000251 /TAXON_ID=180227 /ORGANISM="Neoparamoeba aestuarina, Strain SoJaBio B1-5/56/2" /LENGTH=295 /DNA_ID=CAMNT_0047935741 /DNA_START=56 /DNA_END=943 /DNA_ORIENTATION=-
MLRYPVLGSCVCIRKNFKLTLSSRTGNSSSLSRFPCHAYFITRRLNRADDDEDDIYTLSKKLDISDFESSKFIDESENGSAIDYMAENDDLCFGKWDTPPVVPEHTPEGVRIEVPSPKESLGRRMSVGDILQESVKMQDDYRPMKNSDSEKKAGFKETVKGRYGSESSVFKTDIETTSSESISDDSSHEDDSLSLDEGQPHELLADADELLHSTELDIEENEASSGHDKMVSVSWLEDSIMGDEAKKVASRESTFPFQRGFLDNSKGTATEGNLPWNKDHVELSGIAGRGRHQNI